MGMTSRLTYALMGVALLAAVALARDLLQLRAIKAYNDAVTAGRPIDAAIFPGDAGRYAAAYAAQLDGRRQDARLIYSQLERSADSRLRAAAHYNTGNTYLEEASAIDMQRDADRAVPLVELAKQSYRAALALAPGHWDARYNLERALRLLPDAYEKKVDEIEGRQSPVRAVIGGDADAPWP